MGGEAGEVVIKNEAAEVRLGEVALLGIPGHVAFQEGHVVAARREGFEQ